MSETLPQKLFKVQKKIGTLYKTSDNPFFRSKYVDLNQVLSVAKETLHEEGLFLLQAPGLNEHGRYIETSIIHAATGEQVFCRVPFSGNEKNMQEIGAATTYGRRFGIVSLLAMEQEDDDGETAVGRGKPASSPAAVEKPKEVVQEIKSPAPAKASRKTILDKITATSKVLLAKKTVSQEDLTKRLSEYNVSSKEDLTDDQAGKLLTQLEGLLK